MKIFLDARRSTLGLVFSLLLTPFSLLHADETARTFLWEQANAQVASATKPDDYLKAARTYNRLMADGVHNGPLLANLGDALVMAGDGANAAAAFTRAERYSGANADTRHGLVAALALQTGRSHVDLPWSRTAFFWHYALPCSVRVFAALAGWSLFWVGILCRILFRRRSAHTFLRSLSEALTVTGALTALLFAASVAITLMNERHDDVTWSSRVFLASTPSETEETP